MQLKTNRNNELTAIMKKNTLGLGYFNFKRKISQINFYIKSIYEDNDILIRLTKERVLGPVIC